MDHIVVVNPTFIPKLTAYGIPEEKLVIFQILSIKVNSMRWTR